MTDDSILLVTTSYDPAPEYIARALGKRGRPTFRLETDRFPSQVRATFRPPNEILFSDGVNTICGDQIAAVWYRRHSPPNLPDSLELRPA